MCVYSVFLVVVIALLCIILLLYIYIEKQKCAHKYAIILYCIVEDGRVMFMYNYVNVGKRYL